uniref:Uncharacterized protein n=1 Tax=Rhizophora mucronata TaxID=61149 RepID=A0A2P2PWI5_RHIMU
MGIKRSIGVQLFPCSVSYELIWNPLFEFIHLCKAKFQKIKANLACHEH